MDMNSPSSTVRWPVLLVLAVTLVLAACDDEEEFAEDDEERPTSIHVVEVETSDIDEMERTVGLVETFSRPRVAAEVAGRLESVEADVGDEVEKGQLLASIDPEPFELARDIADAEVDRLKARIDQLEIDLARLERMSEREYVTEQERDSTRAELDATRQQLRGARSERSRAERELRLTGITAPVSGQVDERRVSEGDFIPAGEMAYRIQPADRFRVVLSYPERTAQRFERGMPVRLTSRLANGDSVEGEISRLRSAVDPGSRSVRAVVEFENENAWRPGMLVTGEVIVDRREASKRVPNHSVVRRPAGRVVYVIEDGRAFEREVEIGVRTGEWTEIRSGVEAGETVATDGADFLTDDTPVEIREDD